MSLKPKYSPLLSRVDPRGGYYSSYLGDGMFWLCNHGLRHFYPGLPRTSRIWIKLTEKPTRTSYPFTRPEDTCAKFGDHSHAIPLLWTFTRFLLEGYDQGYRHISIIRKVGR